MTSAITLLVHFMLDFIGVCIRQHFEQAPEKARTREDRDCNTSQPGQPPAKENDL